MTVTNTGPSSLVDPTVTLYRVQANWGEGTSVAPGGGGAGAPATPGDATWLHRFSPSTFWATPGGDFVGTASAAATLTGTGPVTWSSAGLLADVQSWVNSPSTNFGWIVRGNEATAGTGIGFASRENFSTASRPSLVVTFTPVPEPSFVLLASAVVGLIGRRFANRHTHRS
jgi:hypothetical protein